ncbi:hypothetical protein [Paenibacillus nasutitermitis]|uniref:Uncharacterized protein n=1 Tax=Paenibacillus nasutitermitis TaxID=1652958 RepID=A0A916Z6N8_9BACL|nr:hypothetical protein [Paenibacillus nasutitermitis]GGD77531.1 hypothetical protein GCM10010911_39450 [Paenibacillus nasutitermitis]
MEQELGVYTVEFTDSIYEIVYYRDVHAFGIEDARHRICRLYPDARIRAVTLLNDEDNTAAKN